MRGGNNRTPTVRRTASARRRRERFIREPSRDPWGYRADPDGFDPEDLDDDPAAAYRD